MENPENKQGDDKTRIKFSSDQNNNTSSQKEDSTRIENNGNSKSQSDNSKKSDNLNSSFNATDNNSDNINKIKEDLKAKPEDKHKITKGTAVAAGVAAGVVGAASGVAAGVHYSDEIKNAFTQTETNAPESIAQEEQNNAQDPNTETTSTTTNPIGTTDNVVSSTADHIPNENDGAQLVSNVTPDNIQDANINNSSTLNIEYHDSSGTYEISCIDVNSDGKIDSMTMDAQMVDGSNVSYTATGDALDQLLMGDIQPASQNDYITLDSNSDLIDLNCEIPEVSNISETSSYTIQSGDTLSELAAQNNTTVEELMAHNPQIENPNLIYTGDQLNIPNQNVETYTPDLNEGIVDDFNIPMNDSNFGVNENIESAAYAQTDWQSFEDTPVDMSNVDDGYLTAMNDTNFDNYGSANNYNDSTLGDSSVNFDFV
jgi:LysM repeat protein